MSGLPSHKMLGLLKFLKEARGFGMGYFSFFGLIATFFNQFLPNLVSGWRLEGGERWWQKVLEGGEGEGDTSFMAVFLWRQLPL